MKYLSPIFYTFTIIILSAFVSSNMVFALGAVDGVAADQKAATGDNITLSDSQGGQTYDSATTQANMNKVIEAGGKGGVVTQTTTLLAFDKVPGFRNAGKMGIAELLNALFKLIIGAALAAAVVRIFYGGFIYATTESISGKGGAKDIIKNAIYGLLLILSAWLIIYTINPALLNFTLFAAKP